MFMELALNALVPLEPLAPPGNGGDMPTGDQVRAARALIRMEANTLAKLADVSPATLRRFESGSTIHRKSLRDIVAALEAKGIEFIELNGVRLKDGRE